MGLSTARGRSMHHLQTALDHETHKFHDTHWVGTGINLPGWAWKTLPTSNDDNSWLNPKVEPWGFWIQWRFKFDPRTVEVYTWTALLCKRLCSPVLPSLCPTVVQSGGGGGASHRGSRHIYWGCLSGDRAWTQDTRSARLSPLQTSYWCGWTGSAQTADRLTTYCTRQWWGMTLN